MQHEKRKAEEKFINIQDGSKHEFQEWKMKNSYEKFFFRVAEGLATSLQSKRGSYISFH